MAWTLLEEAVKALVSAVVGCVLGWAWCSKEADVASKACMIPKCQRPGVKRGMCLLCYSKAKHKVEIGETTWAWLAERGLCEPDVDPFDDAYSRASSDDLQDRLHFNRDGGS